MLPSRRQDDDVVGLTVVRPPLPDAAPLHVQLVDHTLQGPAQARSAVDQCVAGLGLGTGTDDLLLVVSELVTNAVRHGAPPVLLEVSVDDDVVMVSVTDGSPRPPQTREADEGAEGGRGMTLVDLLSSACGVRPLPLGKAVWACLPRHPAVHPEA